MLAERGTSVEENAAFTELSGACVSSNGLIPVRWVEQVLADVPSDNSWLSAREAAGLAGMRVPKRREDWRLGRWTAKRAVASYLKMPSDPAALATIEVLPTVSGAPEVFLQGVPAEIAVSLSHRAGRAACALAPAGTMLGCDLELVESRCHAFVTDYFTEQEQELVARAPAAARYRILALLWSAKESALKAVGEGLRIDPRWVAVSVDQNSERELSAPELVPSPSSMTPWRPLCAVLEERELQGWWHRAGDFVRTMVSKPASRPPFIIDCSV